MRSLRRSSLKNRMLFYRTLYLFTIYNNMRDRAYSYITTYHQLHTRAYNHITTYNKLFHRAYRYITIHTIMRGRALYYFLYLLNISGRPDRFFKDTCAKQAVLMKPVRSCPQFIEMTLKMSHVKINMV